MFLEPGAVVVLIDFAQSAGEQAVGEDPADVGQAQFEDRPEAPERDVQVSLWLEVLAHPVGELFEEPQQEVVLFGGVLRRVILHAFGQLPRGDEEREFSGTFDIGLDRAGEVGNIALYSFPQRVTLFALPGGTRRITQRFKEADHEGDGALHVVPDCPYGVSRVWGSRDAVVLGKIDRPEFPAVRVLIGEADKTRLFKRLVPARQRRVRRAVELGITLPDDAERVLIEAEPQTGAGRALLYGHAAHGHLPLCRRVATPADRR